MCATLDYKNGLLSAQIVELEDKVKQLQLAMESRAVAAPAAPVAPVAKGPVPIKPAVPTKKAAAAVEPAGFPWLLAGGVGVAVLALLGAAVFFILRRKRKSVVLAGNGGEEGAPPVVPPEDRADYMAKLKETLQRKKKAPKPE